MLKLLLNDKEYNILQFNRSTNFKDGEVFSYGYISMNYTMSVSTQIHEQALEPISSLTIKDIDDETLYDLTNVEIQIVSIDETVNSTEKVININIHFN